MILFRKLLKASLRSAITLVILFFSLNSTKAQELYCKVIIDATSLSSTGSESYLDKTLISDMESNFEKFMSNTPFTNIVLKQRERIVCNIAISITEVSQTGSYKANTQIQAVRPVYGSSFESVTLNYFDKDFEFQYSQGQPLNYVANTFTDHITSLLSYYAFLIIGMDLDGFSKLGGSALLESAQSVAQMADQNGYIGWGFKSNPNARYWLIENLMGQQFTPMREAFYIYHRLGLDLLQTEPETGRKNILEALKKIEAVHKVKPGSLLVRSFFVAKGAEIGKVFSEGEMSTRQEASTILKRIDPTNTEKYDEMLKSR